MINLARGAINKDGSRVIAGGYGGNAKVYENNNGSWSQLGSELDGEEVDINDDGDIVAIGKWQPGNNHSYIKGIAKVLNGTGLLEPVRIRYRRRCNWRCIRSWVALNSDGTILAAGGYGNDDSGDLAGNAKVFKWDGSSWNQLGSNINGESAKDHFGFKVALNHDGNRLAVGAIQDDNQSKSGYVKIYDYVDGIGIKFIK